VHPAAATDSYTTTEACAAHAYAVSVRVCLNTNGLFLIKSTAVVVACVQSDCICAAVVDADMALLEIVSRTRC
jgi:hypothetical protein